MSDSTLMVVEQATHDSLFDGGERLLAVVQDLSSQQEVGGVIQVIRRTARELTGADGVTLVLREGDLVYYAEEDAIGPLWRGRRFPANACISGWAMLNRTSVVIEDIYADTRIPHDAYRPTFVKSLVMVPIRTADPIGAIGAYWAERHQASYREVMLLQALASATAVALMNAELLGNAKRAVEARDEFISIASHELKTPLTPLGLYLDGLERGLDRGSDPATLRPLVRKMRGSMQRVSQLVDKLLQMSALARGPIDLVPGDVDLVEITRSIIEGFEGEMLRTGSRITLDARGPVLVQGDRMRLEQVIINLVSNALKYGDGKPIEITIDEGERRARLVVRDQGIGISREDQARIFERFERAASARSYGGFGIGLWLVRQIVEAHEGGVSVDSHPGAGAAFTVLLPRTLGKELCSASS